MKEQLSQGKRREREGSLSGRILKPQRTRLAYMFRKGDRDELATRVLGMV